MDDDLPKLLETILAHLEANLARAGRDIADAIPYGCVLSGGEASKCGRRWFYVIATNDAATDLEQFAQEQVKGRREAALRAGITFIGSA